MFVLISHQMSEICMLAYLASVITRFKLLHPGTAVTMSTLKDHTPQNIIPLSKLPNLVRHAFKPSVHKEQHTEDLKLVQNTNDETFTIKNGKATRKEKVAMISEIKSWTYTKTQQTSTHTKAIHTNHVIHTVQVA